jgi:hypothetical protein
LVFPPLSFSTRFREKIAKAAYNEKLKFRILLTGEFIRFRRRVRAALMLNTRGMADLNPPRTFSALRAFDNVNLGGPVSATASLDATSIAVRRDPGRESVQESITAAETYERSVSWSRVISVIDRYRVDVEVCYFV